MTTEKQQEKPSPTIPGVDQIKGAAYNAITAMLRRVTGIFVKKIKAKSGTFLFEQLDNWLATNDVAIFGSQLNIEEDYQNRKITKTSVLGSSLFRFNQYSLVLIDGTLEEYKSVYNPTPYTVPVYNIYFIGKQSELRKFLAMFENTKHREDIPYIYNSYGSWWEKYLPLRNISMDSIILPDQLKNELVSDINKFMVNEEEYTKRNLLYKRAYLLYGPPGNGKSSFILALANYYKKNIYWISISKLSTMPSEEILSLLQRMRKGSFLVIEDIDRLNVEHDANQATAKTANTDIANGAPTPEVAKKTSFSEILNVLSGVISPDNYIMFATTNNIEKIDSALLRTGRLDKKVCFDNPTDEQKLRLIRRFTPGQDDYYYTHMLNKFDDCVSMSDIQERLLSDYRIELK